MRESAGDCDAVIPRSWLLLAFQFCITECTLHALALFVFMIVHVHWVQLKAGTVNLIDVCRSCRVREVTQVNASGRVARTRQLQRARDGGERGET